MLFRGAESPRYTFEAINDTLVTEPRIPNHLTFR